jgi:hypothetical protein
VSTTDWRGRTVLETKEKLLQNLLEVIRDDNLESTGKVSRWGY